MFVFCPINIRISSISIALDPPTGDLGVHPIPEVQREAPEWAQEIPNLPPEAKGVFFYPK